MMLVLLPTVNIISPSMPFYNEQTYYSPRGSYRLAYASPTLRLWYAYGTRGTHRFHGFHRYCTSRFLLGLRPRAQGLASLARGLFLLEVLLYFVKSQGSAGYDALLHLVEVGLVQYAAIPTLVLLKHPELGSDGLGTVSVGVVAQEVVVGCLERHLAGKHPRTALDIGVDLRIDHHRTHQDAVVGHSGNDEVLLVVNARPGANEHRSGRHGQVAQAFER